MLKKYAMINYDIQVMINYILCYDNIYIYVYHKVCNVTEKQQNINIVFFFTKIIAIHAWNIDTKGIFCVLNFD